MLYINITTIMNTTRQNKVSRLIQKELSEFFLKESRNEFGGAMITTTVVRITPDLSLARVYISVFPTEKRDETMQKITLKNRYIRHYLAQRVKNQLRKMPELEFYIDDSLDYADRIGQLLKS